MRSRKLRNGLIFMVIAVLSMPLGLLLKDLHPKAAMVALLISMVLELIGLILVILGILVKKKEEASYD